jgi:hypothetical protein
LLGADLVPGEVTLAEVRGQTNPMGMQRPATLPLVHWRLRPVLLPELSEGAFLYASAEVGDQFLAAQVFSLLIDLFLNPPLHLHAVK